MNIQSNLDSASSVPKQTAVPRAAASPLGASGAGSSSSSPGIADGDRANLSPAAVLAAASSALPEARTEKVAAIQAALAAGSYAVSPSDVAGKLIDHLLQN